MENPVVLANNDDAYEGHQGGDLLISTSFSKQLEVKASVSQPHDDDVCEPVAFDERNETEHLEKELDGREGEKEERQTDTEDAKVAEESDASVFSKTMESNASLTSEEPDIAEKELLEDMKQDVEEKSTEAEDEADEKVGDYTIEDCNDAEKNSSAEEVDEKDETECGRAEKENSNAIEEKAEAETENIEKDTNTNIEETIASKKVVDDELVIEKSDIANNNADDVVNNKSLEDTKSSASEKDAVVQDVKEEVISCDEEAGIPEKNGFLEDMKSSASEKDTVVQDVKEEVLSCDVEAGVPMENKFLEDMKSSALEKDALGQFFKEPGNVQSEDVIQKDEAAHYQTFCTDNSALESLSEFLSSARSYLVGKFTQLQPSNKDCASGDEKVAEKEVPAAVTGAENGKVEDKNEVLGSLKAWAASEEVQSVVASAETQFYDIVDKLEVKARDKAKKAEDISSFAQKAADNFNVGIDRIAKSFGMSQDEEALSNYSPGNNSESAEDSSAPKSDVADEIPEEPDKETKNKNVATLAKDVEKTESSTENPDTAENLKCTTAAIDSENNTNPTEVVDAVKESESTTDNTNSKEKESKKESKPMLLLKKIRSSRIRSFGKKFSSSKNV